MLLGSSRLRGHLPTTFKRNLEKQDKKILLFQETELSDPKSKKIRFSQKMFFLCSENETF